MPRNQSHRRKYRNTITNLKWCPHCTSFKRLYDFGFDKSRDDGLSGWCSRCRANNEKRRRQKDELYRAELRARYAKDPARFKAHVYVARAVASGKLVKPSTCPVCCIEGRKVEAHHFAGYAKENWLKVVWLCRQCHAMEHKRGSITADEAAA